MQHDSDLSMEVDCAFIEDSLAVIRDSQTAFSTGADLRFFSLLHFRQYLSSNLHFRQLNGSKTRIADQVDRRNL
jgi:type I site-specific restriction endonuclease